MSFLRTLKKLILGETWILPCGIGILLGASALIENAWPDLAGPVLLVGVLLVLVVSVAWTTRGARRT
jgi:hypothetical protein